MTNATDILQSRRRPHELEVRDLRIETRPASSGETSPLKQVSLTVARGEVVALVGMSGAGKSLTALAVMGLLPTNLHIASGIVTYDGIDLVTDVAQVRGARLAMLFQEPGTSLPPSFVVTSSLVDALRRHRGFARRSARREAIAWLERVGIERASHRADDYPHQFSGGELQRIGLALALCGEPELLLADEPTSALDAAVADQVLDVLFDLRRENDLGLLFVTHDLGLVEATADRMVVVDDGATVEDGPTSALMTRPHHAATRRLLDARSEIGS